MAYFTKREDDALKAIKQNIEIRCHKEDPSRYIDPEAVELTVIEENQLFNDVIHPAFKKLVDNLIFKYNLVNDENVRDLRSDLISHLIFRIEEYDYVKAKAFSFYNVICRNYILGYIQKRKKRNSLVSLDRKDTHESPNGADEATMKRAHMANDFADMSYETYGEPEENRTAKFFKFLKQKIARDIVRSEDKQERDFLRNTLHILETTSSEDEIDSSITNRNLFYAAIRALTDMKQRDISREYNKLRAKFKDIAEEFNSSY